MSDLPFREIEVKAVVDDLAARRRLVELSGGRLVFAGAMADRRYDTPHGELGDRDDVLRLRVYRPADACGTVRAEIAWKGPATSERGYKLRDELSARVTDPEAMHGILARLGYVVTRAIDRDIAQYEIGEATIRFEQYPLMDVLVEVEGTQAGIERAIIALGLPRVSFTNQSLDSFVARFETRTGMAASLAHAGAAGVESRG